MHKTDPLAPEAGTARSRNRDKLEAAILDVATRLFAECGYEGTSIALIAERAGLSKQNLLYYFPTKPALYERVLDDVLDAWLERMDILAAEDLEPADALRAYIVAKLRFSREQPWGSRVYAMEVIGGAKMYGPQIKKKVIPLLRKDIEIFERWIAAGKIAPVNATHLIFSIWAMTQSYADFSTQMALVLNRKQLNAGDFEDAEQLIVRMVLGAVTAPQAR
ncbi:MAG TPA: TetR/AcrR family transcriptional regulator [Burkholderiaceae bacterium]